MFEVQHVESIIVMKRSFTGGIVHIDLIMVLTHKIYSHQGRRKEVLSGVAQQLKF